METHERNPHDRPRKRGLALALAAAGTLVLVTGVLLVLANQPNNMAREQFRATQEQVSFPLYYPKELPDGVTTDGMVHQSGKVVSFTLGTAGGKQLVVTQQARPERMEEVVKTRSVSTNLGKAYIADLNG